MMSKMASFSSMCELTDINLDSDLESMELVCNSDCSESPPAEEVQNVRSEKVSACKFKQSLSLPQHISSPL